METIRTILMYCMIALLVREMCKFYLLYYFCKEAKKLILTTNQPLNIEKSVENLRKIFAEKKWLTKKEKESMIAFIKQKLYFYNYCFSKYRNRKEVR